MDRLTLAKIGLNALIDEATGYQEVRPADDLRKQAEELEPQKSRTKKYRSILKINGPLLNKDTSLQKRGSNDNSSKRSEEPGSLEEKPEDTPAKVSFERRVPRRGG